MDKLKSLDIHFQDIPLTPNQPREWAYHKRIAKDTATLKSLCIHFPAMLWFHIFFCGAGTGTRKISRTGTRGPKKCGTGTTILMETTYRIFCGSGTRGQKNAGPEPEPQHCFPDTLSPPPLRAWAYQRRRPRFSNTPILGVHCQKIIINQWHGYNREGGGMKHRFPCPAKAIRCNVTQYSYLRHSLPKLNFCLASPTKGMVVSEAKVKGGTPSKGKLCPKCQFRTLPPPLFPRHNPRASP